MIAGLIVAGLASFAAGFVLRIGAFALFALIISVLCFVIIHEKGTIIASLISVAVLFATMQIAYTIGVLASSPMRRGSLRRRVDPPRDKTGGSTRRR